MTATDELSASNFYDAAREDAGICYATQDLSGWTIAICFFDRNTLFHWSSVSKMSLRVKRIMIRILQYKSQGFHVCYENLE